MSNDNQYYIGEFEMDGRKYAGQITIICKTGEIFLTLTIATDISESIIAKLKP